MSTLKLSPEEIREKARNIATNAVKTGGFIDSATNAFIKLLEDATGEKITEPFDASNVKHGAVFEWGSDRVLILQHCSNHSEYSVIFLSKSEACNGKVSDDDFPTGPLSVMVSTLRLRGKKYLGQFNFNKGLEHLTK